MNDFLQSLRGNAQKEKRTPKTRRGFDNGNHYNTGPGFQQNHGNYPGGRSGNMKRPVTRAASQVPHMPGVDQPPPYLSMEPVDIMMELMDVYTKNQELLINIEERRVMVEERKAVALEEIADAIREIRTPGALKALLNVKEDHLFGEDDNRSDGTSQRVTPGEEPGMEREPTVVAQDNPSPGTGRRHEVGHGAQLDEMDPLTDGDMPLSSQAEAHSVDTSDDEKEVMDKIRDTSSRERSTHVPSHQALGRGSHAPESPHHPPQQSDDLFPPRPSQAPDDEGHFIHAKGPRGRKVVPTAAPPAEERSTVLRKKSRGAEPVVETIRKPSPRRGEPVQVIKRKKSEESTSSSKPKAVKPKAATSERTPVSDVGLLPRDEVMNIIDVMRKQGATYDQVAQHLVDLGQPTFSGRGEWHAQTIHRLCNAQKKKKKK